MIKPTLLHDGFGGINAALDFCWFVINVADENDGEVTV